MLSSEPEIQVPEPFFLDATVASGLNDPSRYPANFESYQIPTLPAEPSIPQRALDAEQEKLKEAYAALMELELRLRKVIGERLETITGPNWRTDRVPEAVRSKCSLRQEESDKDGKSLHPIYFSHIGELKDIMSRRDNWDDAFKEIFVNRDIYSAMFAFVTPVRNDVMHPRPLSQRKFRNLLFGARWFQEQMDEFK